MSARTCDQCRHVASTNGPLARCGWVDNAIGEAGAYGGDRLRELFGEER